MIFLRTLGPLAILALVLACNSASKTTGSACTAAGGTCVGGDVTCTTQPPAGADDCETTPPNPGGFHCCMAWDDAGAPPADEDANAPVGALDAGLGSPATYASMTCAQRTTAADDAVYAASVQAEAIPSDVSCTTNADCVVASNSSTCWNGCGVVLNQTGASQLQALVAQIDATICAAFAADGCKANPPPPCAPLLPSCVKGVCNDFPAPPSNDAGGDAH